MMAISWKKGGYLLAGLLLLLAFAVRAEETEANQDSSVATEETSASAEDAGNTDQEMSPVRQSTATSSRESTRPPRNLKKVGDHWTPYDPPDPESFPEGAMIHIIVRGDTLWDLAQTHFENPYLWPQIWNENRYILDSHWIYPGDPLLVPPRPTIVSEMEPASDTGSAADGEPPATASEEPVQVADMRPAQPAPEPPAAPGAPNLAADYSDIYCTGEIRSDYEKTDLYIAGAEQESRVTLTSGDLVYLNAGREEERVHVGETYLIIAKSDEIFHPVTDRWVGSLVNRRGKVKVLAVQQETAIAQIVESCGDGVEVGFELEPDREILVPEARHMPLSKLDVEPSGKANGHVVYLQDGRRGASAGQIVHVDLGSEDGVHPGDLLLVYRGNLMPAVGGIDYHYKWQKRRHESQALRTEDSHLPYPRKPVGQVIVLATDLHTATTKIIDNFEEIEVGHGVEVR